MVCSEPLSGRSIDALIAVVGSSNCGPDQAVLHPGGSHSGGSLSAQTTQSRRTPKRAAQKVSCEQCFFRVNLLCALELAEPCATFRPHEAQLRPPQQLRFVFRQERRSRAAWAFPSAEEQAALHA